MGREAERTGQAVGIGRGLGSRGGPSPPTVRLQGWAAGLPAVTARLPHRRSCSTLLRSSPRAGHDGITVQGELLGKSAGRAADLRARDPPGPAAGAGPRRGQADGPPRSAPLRDRARRRVPGVPGNPAGAGGPSPAAQGQNPRGHSATALLLPRPPAGRASASLRVSSLGSLLPPVPPAARTPADGNSPRPHRVGTSNPHLTVEETETQREERLDCRE